jgi:2-iminobutanoate/2-iminopropanoate deaminase
MEFLNNIDQLPEPRGPFSQAVKSGGFLFISGQGPYDPKTKQFHSGSIGEQTKLTLACIGRVLEEEGLTPKDVVQCRVYLQPQTTETFQKMNAAYSEFFRDHTPARTTIGAGLLNIDVEVDCIAQLK